MSYLVVIERGEDSFGAYAPDLPGCVAGGKSREEVLRLVHEAIEVHIQGLPIPEPRSQAEVVGTAG